MTTIEARKLFEHRVLAGTVANALSNSPAMRYKRMTAPEYFEVLMNPDPANCGCEICELGLRFQ